MDATARPPSQHSIRAVSTVLVLPSPWGFPLKHMMVLQVLYGTTVRRASSRWSKSFQRLSRVARPLSGRRLRGKPPGTPSAWRTDCRCLDILHI